MKSLQSLIEGLAYNESHVICYRNEIWLEFDNFTLVLHYDSPEEGVFPDDDYFELKDIKASGLHIDEVCLACGTNADEESYQENNISYTASMLLMCKQIQREFPGCIERYVVDTFFLDDCDLYGCPENAEYGYRIYLRASFWEDNPFLQKLTSGNWRTEVGYPIYYLPFSDYKLSEDFHFAFLGTNTKVRRMGYLGVLLSLFKDSPRIAKKNLSRLLEQKAQDYRSALDSYKNQKGVILPSKTGVSAIPYIKLAMEMGIIREMTGHYELGKMGRVYVEMQKETYIEHTNPFELTAIEKMFWLERLLEDDFVYLFTLMEYAFVCDTPSYSDLRKQFNVLVLKKLEILYSNAHETLPKTALRSAIRRIKGWKKAEVYLEHVLMPRLNWLYDLGLLDLRRDLTFELTREGRLLFLNMAVWRDLRQADVCNPTSLLDVYYMHVANDVFMEGQGRDNEDTRDALTEVLAYSFDHFKTMAPNRVTYSVYQAFAKYTLLRDKLLVVESADIKENYLPSLTDRYVFMFQRYYNDGFIQKK